MYAGVKTFNKVWEEQDHRKIQRSILIQERTTRFVNPSFNSILNASPVITFIINHDSSTYEYLSDNTTPILGYPSIDFLKGGVSFGLSMVETSDREAIHQFVEPTLSAYMHRFAKQGELHKVNFSFNYKIRKSDGSLIWVLETMTVIEVNEQGFPLLSLFHLVDITHSKKDDKIDLCIHKQVKNGQYMPIHSSSYAVVKKAATCFTEREEEILEEILKGYSSKEIADRLYISLHTVSSHRKNMLKKTGCKNAFELMHLYNSNSLVA